MFAPRRRHRGGQGFGLPLLLLGGQMARVGFDRIPPVTLATIVGQAAVFLRLFKVPKIDKVCISAVKVWYKEDWSRLLYASFFHANDWHLYYNMASFLWKGITLERKLGSGYFLYMIAVFSLLTNITTVGLGMLADHMLDDSSYLYQCAVGFSGVLFALKVVSTHMMPRGTQYVMGFIPVNSRFACWAELILIQILVPNASFIGHLAGILVGLMYVRGPLKPIMDSVVPSGPSYTYRSGTTGRTSGGRSYTYHSGTTGSASGGRARQQYYADDRPQQNADHRYATYTGGLSEEVQLQEALRSSMTDAPRPNSHHVEPSAPPPPRPPPYAPPTAPPDYEELYAQNGGVSSQARLYPDLSSVDQDEIRKRRLDRFSKS